jgi:hypothetical protein
VTPVREPQPIAELVERIVRESQIASAAAREELRRELTAHFEDAVETGRSLDAALERFGDATQIAAGFRRAYGRARLVGYVAKVLASVVVSAALALGIQALVNLRLEPGTGGVLLGPWFGTAALISLALVVLAVAAWELGIEPLCQRLERRPRQLLLIFVAFSIGAYITHLIIDRLVDPAHTLLGSAATMSVWVCTIAILAGCERAFIRRFGAAK